VISSHMCNIRQQEEICPIGKVFSYAMATTRVARMVANLRIIKVIYRNKHNRTKQCQLTILS
jgi:hypothetical protein